METLVFKEITTLNEARNYIIAEDFPKIAEIAGCSEGTVRNTLSEIQRNIPCTTFLLLFANARKRKVYELANVIANGVEK